MKGSGALLTPPGEPCSRMHGSPSIRAPPQMTSRLRVLILSCLLSIQPALSQLVFSTRPQDGAGVLGAPLALHCAVYDSRRQKAAPVRWVRAGGAPLTDDVRRMENGTLLFPRLAEAHLGQYECRAAAAAHRVSAVVHVEEVGLEPVYFSPRAQTASEGDSVFLQCVSGDSSPPANITWLKDGTLVTKGRQIQDQYGGGNERKTSSTLHLWNVTLEDDGTYVCVTRNPVLHVRRESETAKLTVQGGPRELRITQGPDNVTVAMGTEASMRCAVRGVPVPMVHWFKDGCPLTNCSASISFRENGQLLVFRNVSEEDEGCYYCEVSNQTQTVRSKPAFLLVAVMGWSFVQEPANQTVKRGESVALVCRAPHSRPTAHIHWFKDNQILPAKAHFTVMPSGDLFFHSIQESDNGNYFCRATNAHLRRSLTSRRVTLTVLAPPTVRLWPQVVTVPVGAQVVLECEVLGYPPPSIRWLKNGRSMQTGGKIAVGVRNATLYIMSVRSYDEGMYTCQASNAEGREHSTARLRVAMSPIIVSFSGHVSSRVGASVVLPCKALGISPITYTWTRNRAETQSSFPAWKERRTPSDDGALYIAAVDWSHAGEYYCTAENQAGRQQRRAVLTVTAEDNPADQGKHTRLSLSARSNTDKELPGPQSGHSGVEHKYGTTHHPHVWTRHRKTTGPASHGYPTSHSIIPTFTSPKDALFGQKVSPGSHDPHSKLLLGQPTSSPTQPTLTQMQPPSLHLNIHTKDPHARLPVTSDPFLLSYIELLTTHSQQPIVNNQHVDSSVSVPLSHSQHHLTEMPVDMQLNHQVTEPFAQTSENGAQVSDVHYQHATIQPSAVSLPGQIVVPRNQMAISESQIYLSPTRPTYTPKQASDSLDPVQNTVTEVQPSHSDSVTLPSASLTDGPLSKTHPPLPSAPSAFTLSQLQPSPTQHSQTHLKLFPPQYLFQKNHLQPSTIPSQPPKTHPQQPFTQGTFPTSQLHPTTAQHDPPSIEPQIPAHRGGAPQTQTQPLPTWPHLALTTSPHPPTHPHSPPTQHQVVQTQPLLPKREPQPTEIQSNSFTDQPSTSTIPPADQNSITSTLDMANLTVSDVHRVTMSDQVQHQNASKHATPVQPLEAHSDPGPTEWMKRNTSQLPTTTDDPKVTSQSPSWLPLLEKHDIPIVVGVGVSLAFIFITMAFYSLVQKNEPAPTSRAAQRNLGVPVRHTECRAASRTYDNKAFEDDECVAVIEQSPNTSDTRARPPGPSLVMVQMEPTSEELQEDPDPTLENRPVSVETYPEPNFDLQIGADPPLEEDKAYSLSQPSIHLQCMEDWTSGGRDNHDPCQDNLPPPPPSSLPSQSPSPSPPIAHEEGLRSSLTLQTAEPHVAPVHHSLSITHGGSPLLLSHRVSLGLTTVAVDVHFCPPATRAGSVSNSTPATATLFRSPLANSQQNDRSASRVHQNK